MELPRLAKSNAAMPNYFPADKYMLTDLLLVADLVNIWLAGRSMLANSGRIFNFLSFFSSDILCPMASATLTGMKITKSSCSRGRRWLSAPAPESHLCSKGSEPVHSAPAAHPLLFTDCFILLNSGGGKDFLAANLCQYSFNN